MAGNVGNRNSLLQGAFGRSDLRIATAKQLGFAGLNPTYELEQKTQELI